jgi:hypothetical protein
MSENVRNIINRINGFGFGFLNGLLTSRCPLKKKIHLNLMLVPFIHDISGINDKS